MEGAPANKVSNVISFLRYVLTEPTYALKWSEDQATTTVTTYATA